jgi:hypothetical protein
MTEHGCARCLLVALSAERERAERQERLAIESFRRAEAAEDKIKNLCDYEEAYRESERAREVTESSARALRKRLDDCLATWDWRADQVTGHERALVAVAAYELRAALEEK